MEDSSIVKHPTKGESAKRKLSLRERCHRFSNQCLDLVSDPGCAIRYTVISLLSTALLYVVVHIFMEEDPTRLSEALTISDDGRFKTYYRDDILDHYFARNRVNEWKQRTDEKCLAFRQDAAMRRLLVLDSVRQFIRGSLENAAPPGGAWHVYTNFTVTNILWVELPSLTNWLGRQYSAVVPSKTNLLNELISQVAALHSDEERWRNHLKAEIASLKEHISFDWFRIHEWRWLVEVFFWCTFGVLANTFITLIFAARENRYDAREFLLVIPKATLAPVLAVVIIAWWATGLSESPINFANIPYFLILSFALGFVTENLYVKIKELGTLIVAPSATASAARMQAAARRDLYKFVHPKVDPGILPAAQTVPELSTQLRTVLKGALEHGIVTRVAGTTPSQE